MGGGGGGGGGEHQLLLATSPFGAPASAAAKLVSLLALLPLACAAARFARQRKLHLLAVFAAAAAVDAAHHACIFGFGERLLAAVDADWVGCAQVAGLDIAVSSMLPLAVAAAYVLRFKEEWMAALVTITCVYIPGRAVAVLGTPEAAYADLVKCWLQVVAVIAANVCVAADSPYVHALLPKECLRLGELLRVVAPWLLGCALFAAPALGPAVLAAAGGQHWPFLAGSRFFVGSAGMGMHWAAGGGGGCSRGGGGGQGCTRGAGAAADDDGAGGTAGGRKSKAAASKGVTVKKTAQTAGGDSGGSGSGGSGGSGGSAGGMAKGFLDLDKGTDAKTEGKKAKLEEKLAQGNENIVSSTGPGGRVLLLSAAAERLQAKPPKKKKGEYEQKVEGRWAKRRLKAMLTQICEFVKVKKHRITITGDAAVVYVESAGAWRPGINVNVEIAFTKKHQNMAYNEAADISALLVFDINDTDKEVLKDTEIDVGITDIDPLDGVTEEIATRLVTELTVSSKALSFCCVSTVFLSKTVPFRAVPLDQAELREQLPEAIAALLQELMTQALGSENVDDKRTRQVSCKALPFCCASTVFLSKTVPFHAVHAQVKEAQEAVANDPLATGKSYWDYYRNQPGVVTKDSGLTYKVLRQGGVVGAPSPAPETPCQCNYRGRLVDGQQFDASEVGSPVTFAPSQVIAGWCEAMQVRRRVH
eukprot:SAG22_NODE_19_length_32182_cov_39.206963_23_plen_702_part_00